MIVSEDAVVRRPRSLPRRAVRVGGTILMALGLLALVWGFVVWRFGDPVTGLYTRWQQRQLQTELSQVQRRYAAPAPAAGAASASADPAAAAAAMRRQARRLRSETGRGEALGRIRVSRIGLDMIVVNGTDRDSLVRGPGVDPRTHLPGEGQLVYIAGHRTTYGAPFAQIDRLRPGDRIELDMPYGKFVYRVSSHVIVPADDLDRLRSRGREEVALQACYPRFSARQRYIVYATPVKTPAS
ncbi:sortase [Gaiella occulta]|uniref:sortase n=1 Tax=Gaiella occulta TaxID=1002870 RepID=UPI000E0B2496|nr:class D sortase [Gaiella occulta]